MKATTAYLWIRSPTLCPLSYRGNRAGIIIHISAAALRQQLLNGMCIGPAPEAHYGPGRACLAMSSYAWRIHAAAQTAMPMNLEPSSASCPILLK